MQSYFKYESRRRDSYLFLIHMRELEEDLLPLYLFHHINIEQITKISFFYFLYIQKYCHILHFLYSLPYTLPIRNCFS